MSTNSPDPSPGALLGGQVLDAQGLDAQCLDAQGLDAQGLDAQVALVRALELQAARTWVAEGEALLGLVERSCTSALSAGSPGRVAAQDHAVAEVAWALGVHERTAGSRVEAARQLADLPLVRGLVRDGRLGLPHVQALLDELGVLDDGEDPERSAALAGLVAREVLTSGGRLGWAGTPGELRRKAQRAVVRLDPQGCERRRLLAERDRAGVRLRDLPLGLAELVATGAAVPLRAADRILDALSGSAGPGDDRSRGQRRVDALVGALVAQAGGGVSVELQLDLPVQVTGEVTPARPMPCGPLEPVVIRTDLDAELLALLTTDPTARAAQPEPSEPAAQAAQPEPAARPARPAAEAEADSPLGGDVTVADLRPGRQRRRPREGVDELPGRHAVDPGLLRDLLGDPHGLPVGLGQVTVRRACIDITGQVVAVDARAVPLGRLLDRAAAPPGRPPRTTPGGPSRPAPDTAPDTAPATPAALLRLLTHDLPDPPAAVDRHDPSADQTRVVHARDPHCTWPGCSLPARRCELDHRTRYPDGPTSTSNLHPLCKHHHRLKHDGWTCTRHPDGTTTWTSPLGLTRTA